MAAGSQHEGALDLVHVDDLASVAEVFGAVGAAGVEIAGHECRCRHSDGGWRRLRWFARSDGEHWHALACDVTQRRDLERRALYDALTGLPNRALLDDRLAQGAGRPAPLPRLAGAAVRRHRRAEGRQ